MKNDLESKIKGSFECETPDFRQNILSICDNEIQAPKKQKKSRQNGQIKFLRYIVAVASCVALFCTGFVMGKNTSVSQPEVNAETCVYLDVNPSLELVLDEYNTVISCIASNEDAETVLNGMKLEGVELKTALNAIVGSMYVKGYLSANDNSILISVDTNDTEHTSGFLEYITQQVNEVFNECEMQCAIIAQGVEADEDLERRAKEKGISVGKMHLLDKMIDAYGNLSEEDISQLSNMSIKDLNLLYAQVPNKEENPKDEVISGSVNIDVTTSEALNAVISSIQKTAEEVEEYHIHLLPSKRGESKVTYAVTIKFYGDESVYRYEVDCTTGEVLIIDNDTLPNKNPEEHENGDMQPPPNENHEQRVG